MLNVRLKPLGSQATPAHLRCWVTDPENDATLLEFHNHATINEAVLAFTLLMPEIVDYLHLAKHECKVADLLLDRMYQIRQQLENEANPKPIKEEVA